MKKVKQILSLMLVIALALGMMSFAAAGPAAMNVDDYKDFDDIKNREAVDVLTAIGILEGDPNGAFNPKSTITREEAAKIVTFVYAGSAAKNLPKRTSVFTDVEDDRWSNPFIMYCQEYGIINGFGDGTFRPTEPVTASQMAKMLLMAMGYGKKDEFIGAKWEGNAIVTAQEVGVLPKSITANYTQNATREDVAQYAYFALIQPTAVFNSFYNEYFTTAGYSGVVTGTGTTPNPSLAAKMFDLHSQPVPDDFGYNLAYWYQGVKTNRLTGLYMRDIVIDEFTVKPMTSKGEMFNNYAWDIEGIELYVNGTRYDRDIDNNNVPIAPDPDDDTIAKWRVSDFAEKGSFATPGPAGVAMPGIYVALVDSDWDNVIDRVIVTYEYLAKVEAVNTVFGTINVTYYDHLGAHLETGIFAEGFSVGDYVNIIWKAASNNPANKTNPATPISVKKAESVTTAITSYTNLSAPSPFAGRPNTITIGDKTYTLSATALDFTSAGPLLTNPMAKNLDNSVFSKEVPVFFDSYGNIIGYDTADLAAGSLNYLYVNGADTSAFSAFAGYPARVSVILSNGERKILELQKKAGTAATFAFAGVDYDLTQNALNGWDALKAALANGWYAYTLNSSGQVALTKADGTVQTGLRANEAVPIVTTAQAVRIFTGVSTITWNDESAGTAYASSNTLLSMVSGGTLKTYTGFANFPSVSLDSSSASGNYNVLFVYARTGPNPGDVSSSLLTHIYVVERVPAPMVAEYGLITGVSGYTQDTVSLNVLLKDGTTKQYTVSKNDESTFTTTIPNVVAINEDGTLDVSNVTTTAGLTVDAIDIGGGNAFFTTTTDIYHYASDCIFYDARSGSSTYGSPVKPKAGDTLTVMAIADASVSNSHMAYIVIITA